MLCISRIIFLLTVDVRKIWSRTILKGRNVEVFSLGELIVFSGKGVQAIKRHAEVCIKV